MKTAPPMIAVILLPWLFMGCDSDFVSNDGNRGTAHVSGITIEVIEAGTGRAGSTTHYNGDKKSNKITLGDVTIKLHAAKGGNHALTINGKKHGTVAKGDNLVISESRNVTVNGSERAAEE